MSDHAGKRHSTASQLFDFADRAEIAFNPAAHNRLGRCPHIQMRVERTADPFHHHHGFLQHHEFGARAHIEEARDFKQKRQEFRHRNLICGTLMDRLANRTNGLGKIID